MLRMQASDTSIPDWAFDDRLKEIVLSRDTKAFLELWPALDEARRSHPTPDHFLPVLYVYALTDARDTVQFPLEGFDHSVSMRAIQFG